MRARAAVFATALAAAAAPSAAAQDGSAPVRGSGAVTVTWSGDPQRGCAQAGVCGVSGSVTWRPARRGELSLVSAGRGRRLALLDLADSRAPIVRVARGAGAEPRPTCVDALDGSVFFAGEPARGPVRVGIASSDGEGPLSAGRCAGPRGRDLRGALPSLRVSPRTIAGGPATIDLTGRERFSTGAFSGEVISTLTIAKGEFRPRRERRERFDDEHDVEDGGPPVAVLLLRYRTATARGALSADLSGLPAPGCTPLDACGAAGSLTLSPGPGGGIDFISIRPARRPSTARAELRALRRGRTDVLGFGRLGRRSTLAAELRWPDGGSCRDAAPVRGLPLEAGPRGRRVRVRSGGDVEGGLFGDSFPLRTRCPGPREDELLGDAEALAVGSLPLRALGRRTVGVVLGASGSFSGDAWAGERGGAIQLVLELEEVRYERLRSDVSVISRARR